MLEEETTVIINLKPIHLAPRKWTEGMKKGSDLTQGSKEVIKMMLSILTFKVNV